MLSQPLNSGGFAQILCRKPVNSLEGFARRLLVAVYSISFFSLQTAKAQLTNVSYIHVSWWCLLLVSPCFSVLNNGP